MFALSILYIVFERVFSRAIKSNVYLSILYIVFPIGEYLENARVVVGLSILYIVFTNPVSVRDLDIKLKLSILYIVFLLGILCL